MNRSRLACFAAIAIGAVLRIAVLIPLHAHPDWALRPDSFEYLRGAADLMRGCYTVFSRPIGWSAFAAACLSICDSMFFLSAALTAVGIATLAITWTAVRRRAGSTAAFIATILLSWNVTAIANGPMMLSDTLFAFAVSIELLLWLRFAERPNVRRAVEMAVVSGIATLIRPIELPHVAVLALMVLLTSPGDFPKRLRLAAAVLAAFSIIVVPYMAFNARRDAGWVVDCNTGAMLHQNGAMLLAEVDGTDFETEKAKLLEEEAEVLPTLPDWKSRERWRMSRYFGMLRSHPLVAAKQQFNWRVLIPDVPTLFEICGVTDHDRGTMGVLAKDGMAAAVRHYFEGRETWIAVGIMLSVVTLITYMLALAALVMDFAAKRWDRVILFVGFVLFYLWLPGAIGAPRYQLPALPALVLFAGTGWTSLAGLQKTRSKTNFTDMDETTHHGGDGQWKD